MSEIRFSSRFLGRFVEAIQLELGTDPFHTMLVLAKLPAEWASPESITTVGSAEAARAYALLQAAMRDYYGRGARGLLLRVGQRLWRQLFEGASLGLRTRAALIKRMPVGNRQKAALEFLIQLIGSSKSDLTVHTLDRNLLLVDHVSPSTEGQHEDHPVCYVTQGIIGESLYWATGQAVDIEEVACKAMGEPTCQFRVNVGRTG